MEIVPLKKLYVNIVTFFEIDYRHLVCPGLTNKVTSMWRISDSNKAIAIGCHQVRILDDQLTQVRKDIPCEFHSG